MNLKQLSAWMLLWRIGWKKLSHSLMELRLTRSSKRGLSRTDSNTLIQHPAPV
ncbi:hypothetical protein L210DRAFT_1036422 [Boletus edulis BED1]|uniref:Uncharacterized protein n=1 Tax=Boletus edulis BED1 TaxID=1328754 RepID=A0AAD4C842_BOLED|nr:hypothetical protein L210DRAFT_1036422 [Boletus edulis BED1]